MPLKDLLVIVPLYLLAISFRHNSPIHARLMRAVGLVASGELSAVITWFVIDASIIVFIVLDRRLQTGKWVFWRVLAMTVSIQAFLIAGGPQSESFTAFARWFASI